MQQHQDPKASSSIPNYTSNFGHSNNPTINSVSATLQNTLQQQGKFGFSNEQRSTSTGASLNDHKNPILDNTFPIKNNVSNVSANSNIWNEDALKKFLQQQQVVTPSGILYWTIITL
jgi:hypothetical protein